MNSIKTLNKIYSRSYEKAPYITLCITNGCLAVITRLQQHKDLIPRPPRLFDPYRTLRFALYNMAVAPIVGRWFIFLESRFPMPSIAQTTKSLFKPADIVTVKRMVTDQTLFAPMSLTLFFSVMGLVETKSLEGVKEKFRDAYLPALKANYQVWPLVQLVNFKFTPLPYRLPVVSTVGIAWNAYLSWLNNASKEEEMAIHKLEEEEKKYIGTRGEQIKLEI
ncbi:hypothetical protein BGW37DRAFT_429940 [Umbelopsis sp. PMI_123]|nr:hypothetical protein BGW37DRAFT_429940 [Umbelopsis sp. PMI_123]